MQRAAIAAGVTLLSACATPPGRLTEADFVTREIRVEAPVSEALSAFYEGLRYCGPQSGGAAFVTHHGVPECSPVRADGSAVCDLYIGAVLGGRPDTVLGRADFRPDGKAANVALSAFRELAS